MSTVSQLLNDRISSSLQSSIRYLITTNFINPPDFVDKNLIYEIIHGSRAYGVATETSDYDVMGIVIPPQSYIFPHLAGYVHGFDDDFPKFLTYKQDHIQPTQTSNSYDVTIYNITHFFNLLYNGNPNVIDTLFYHTPNFRTSVSNLMVDNRKLFLSKKCWISHSNFATNLWKKTKRSYDPATKQYDFRTAYNCFRVLECGRQIVQDNDIYMSDCSRTPQMRWQQIRAGCITFEQLQTEFNRTIENIDKVAAQSTLVDEPDKRAIKMLLKECLKMHYGESLDFFKF